MTTEIAAVAALDVLSAFHQLDSFEAAHEAGIFYVCLDCGSVGGINPDAPLGNHADVDAARVATRDNLWIQCCTPESTILI